MIEVLHQKLFHQQLKFVWLFLSCLGCDLKRGALCPLPKGWARPHPCAQDPGTSQSCTPSNLGNAAAVPACPQPAVPGGAASCGKSQISLHEVISVLPVPAVSWCWANPAGFSSPAAAPVPCPSCSVVSSVPDPCGSTAVTFPAAFPAQSSRSHWHRD